MVMQKNHDEHEDSIRDNSKEYECSEQVYAADDSPFDPTVLPLPSRYNKDMLVVMPINPWQVFCYWEISEDRLNKFKTNLTETVFSSSYLELCLYIIDRKTYKIPKKPLWRYNVEDAADSCNWYVAFDNAINYENPLNIFYAELGYRCPDGTFHILLQNRPLIAVTKKPSEPSSIEHETTTVVTAQTAEEQWHGETIPSYEIKEELESSFKDKEPELVETALKLQALFNVIDIDKALEFMKALELPKSLTEPEDTFRAYIEEKMDELSKSPEEEPVGPSESSGSGYKGK